MLFQDKMNKKKGDSMGSKRPMFSIVIPVYNTGRMLDRMMESIQNQTYQDYEVILMDDGSTDDTAEVCDDWARKDGRIQSRHIKNLGAFAAREQGIALASGDWILLYDADDSIPEHSLEVLAGRIVSDHPDLIVYGMNRIVDGKTEEHKDIEKEETVTDVSDLFLRMLTDNSLNPMWRKAIRRDLIAGKSHEEYYQVVYGEDLIQSLDVLLSSSKTLFLPDRLYNYILNPEGLTSSIAADNYHPDYTVREAVLRTVEQNHLFDERQLQEYRGYCMRLLFEQLRRISRFDASRDIKKKLVREVQESDYVRSFLMNQPYDKKYLGKRDLILQPFLKGRPGQTMLALEALRLLGK